MSSVEIREVANESFRRNIVQLRPEICLSCPLLYKRIKKIKTLLMCGCNVIGYEFKNSIVMKYGIPFDCPYEMEYFIINDPPPYERKEKAPWWLKLYVWLFDYNYWYQNIYKRIKLNVK